MRQEWNTNKVIDFVNWYIDLKDLGENNKLENKTIVESFLDGDSVDVWENIKLFPKHYIFLEDRFVWDEKYDAFKSKKKQLGCSAGDDRNLYMIVGIGGTLIWWRNSRGQEETIFDGRELKTEEEFNQVFELLEINKTLKWNL